MVFRVEGARALALGSPIDQAEIIASGAAGSRVSALIFSVSAAVAVCAPTAPAFPCGDGRFL